MRLWQLDGDYKSKVIYQTICQKRMHKKEIHHIPNFWWNSNFVLLPHSFCPHVALTGRSRVFPGAQEDTSELNIIKQHT